MYKFYTENVVRPPGPIKKFLLVMKITMFFLFAAFMQVAAAGLAQKVTFVQKDATLRQVFNEINKQTNYNIIWSAGQVNGDQTVNANFRDTPLADVLDKCLENTGLTYTIEEKSVVIKQKEPSLLDKLKNKINAIVTPPGTISGRVTNMQNEPLPGATIKFKKTQTGVQADANGKFTLDKVNIGDTLLVSYIGYKTLIVPVTKETDYNIRLDLATNNLDQVVVQAYGITTQRITTGNIGSVSAKEIAEQPVMNPLLALEGKVAGLVVTQQNGYASAPVRVEIRGRNGIDPNFSSDPLYIIDGVPLTVLNLNPGSGVSNGLNATSTGFDTFGASPAGGQNPLFSLDPSSIESIEVLKDADATSIYGSRGANGVILITTKKGKPGKNRFDLNISQGISTDAGKEWQMLNTQQYIAMREEAFKNNDIVPTVANAPDLLLWNTHSYTDWQKYLYGGTGEWTNVQAALSGGTDQTTFRLAGGYNGSTDITSFSGDNKRASVSFNLTTHSLNRRFTASFTANYSYAEVNEIDLPTVATLPPDAPPIFNSSGGLNYAQWDTLNPDGTYQTSYPFENLLQPYVSKTNFLTSDLTLSYSILKGLVLRTSIGYNNTTANQTSSEPIASQDPSTDPTGTANFGTTRVNNWIIEPQAEYNTLISRGKLNILLGGTAQDNLTEGSRVTGSAYTNDALMGTINNAPSVSAIDNYARYKYAGVFGRIGYNWEDRYILNLNARRDGSSRFGPGRQYGNFGSAGAAWIASEESWMKKVLPSWVSLVKLRGSYGITGSDNVSDYAYLSQFGNQNPVLRTYGGTSPLESQIQPNSDYHWQVNRKLEGALDLGFLQDRISLEVAYYRDRCDNQLVSFPTPQLTGFTSVVENSPADVQNSGWEFLLNANLIKQRDFSWTVKFTTGFNKNILLAYPNIAQSPYYGYYKVGESLNNVYLLNYTGVDPLTGQYTFTDHNHDGLISITSSGSNPSPPGTGIDDRYITINLAPKFDGMLGNEFSYKNWSLRAFFHIKKQIGINALNTSTAGGIGNISSYRYQYRWQNPGDISSVARLSVAPQPSDTNFQYYSNGVYTDASFIRLQTLVLAYRLPDKLARKIGMNSLSLNFDAENLLLITNYKGVDPETQNFGGLPPAKTATVGLNASF